RVGDARERADADVIEVGWLVPRAHIDLVPEIERNSDAVEPWPKVRGRSGRADAQRVGQATAAIASGSGSTATGGGVSRSTASGSLSPWPVMTQTTRVPGASPAGPSAAAPA